MQRTSRLTVCLSLVALAACGGDPNQRDGGSGDGGGMVTPRPDVVRVDRVDPPADVEIPDEPIVEDVTPIEDVPPVEDVVTPDAEAAVTVDVLDDEQHYGSELMFRLRSAEDGVSRLAETVVHQSSTIYNMTESHELLVKENERLLKEIEQLQVDHARYVLGATDLVDDVDAPIPLTLVKTIESEVVDQLDQDGVGQLVEDDASVTSIGGPIYSD